jgi:hypothetical protein
MENHRKLPGLAPHRRRCAHGHGPRRPPAFGQWEKGIRDPVGQDLLKLTIDERKVSRGGMARRQCRGRRLGQRLRRAAHAAPPATENIAAERSEPAATAR